MTLELSAMSPTTTAAVGRRKGRWMWIAFFVLVLAPLYAIAVTVCIRSSLFSFGSGPLTSEQSRDVWTFLGAGLAAAATSLGALLVKSHNDRTLSMQAESEKQKQIAEADSNVRLKMDTVFNGLQVICSDRDYSPKAAVAGGLAALVQLGHPIIAMRTLSAAVTDGKVDWDTTGWLCGQVLTTTTTTGTEDDLNTAREEAASLLRFYASKFADVTNQGATAWPDSVCGRWPKGLSTNAGMNLIYGLVDLLLSQTKEWWNVGTHSHSWIIYTLYEVLQNENNEALQHVAATLGSALLEVTDDEWISGIDSALRKSEVVGRMSSVAVAEDDVELQEQIRAWGRGDGQPQPGSVMPVFAS